MPEYNSVENEYREWQCPPAASSETRLLGWLNEATEEGQAWLKNQRGYRDFRKALDVISGSDYSTRQPSSDYRSKLSPNPLKRNIREIISALAKLRPMWGYHSDNQAYKEHASLMNKVTKAIYLEQHFDIQVKKALAYSSATARGWLRPVYRRDMYGTGEGAIQLLAYGAPCVLPVQLPQDGNFQNAYAVTILEEMPVAMAHGMFPSFQSALRPSASRYWYMNDGVRRASQGNLLQRIFGKAPRQPGTDAMSDLLVPIRYTYVIDLTVNTTKGEIVMGEPGSSWSYTVPHIGQEIRIGSSPTGGSIYRKADANDARLYPYRRLLISSDTVKLYDGPSFDWHGMLPLASFCLDAWPWEPLGFSLIHEGYELNESIKEIDRGSMDKVRANLDMSLMYDSNAMSMNEARQLDPMMPRGRYGFDGNAVAEGHSPVQPAVPLEVLKIDPMSLEFRQILKNTMDEQLALKDINTLTKLRSLGNTDELEKVLEANGPIVEGMSRDMEAPMRDIGTMVKFLVLQYMTTQRIMQYVGEDGVSAEVFDYNPATLIPSHIPGENVDQPSAHSQIARARLFANNLRFLIMPNTLHEMAQMTMKLGLIQLKKAGVTIDSETLAEPWSIPNFGTIEGDTVIKKYWNEKEQELLHMARMQQILGEVVPGAGAPPGAAGPGKQNPEGRPTSGQAAPRLVSKDGGARSTIAESR